MGAGSDFLAVLNKQELLVNCPQEADGASAHLCLCPEPPGAYKQKDLERSSDFQPRAWHLFKYSLTLLRMYVLPCLSLLSKDFLSRYLG